MNIPYERENLEWRNIEGFEGIYEVSNYGDFHVIPSKSRSEKFYWSEELHPYGGTDGFTYLGIHLGGTNKSYAHRLAGKAFIPNPGNKPEINHKDGNPRNNYCGCKNNNYKDSNLEWVTSKENMKHAVENGLINHASILRKVVLAKNREKIDYEAMKKPVVQLQFDGTYVNTYSSLKEAGDSTGIEVSTIREAAAKKGYRKTAGGFNWVYKEEYDPEKDYTVVVDQGRSARKPVIQKTLDGDFVAEYKSITEACEKTGFPGNSYISECCKGKRKYYKNYKWEYKK